MSDYGRNAAPSYRRGDSVPRSRDAPRGIQMIPAKSPDNSYTFGNLVAVSAQDVQPERDRQDTYLLLNNYYVVSARPINNFPPGSISLSDAQRTWMQIALTDRVDVQRYDPFRDGPQGYLGGLVVEVGFAGRKTTETPYEQDELEQAFKQTFRNQIFAPGQQLLMDFKSIPLKLTVKSVELVDLSQEKPDLQPQQRSDAGARGILVQETSADFVKDPKTIIKIKSSSHKPAAQSIVRPDFNFDQLGVGGLDKEFSNLFRRAFSSRIFPPGMADSLGIQHVRGILLYGPPGTGKTLIARQIRHMLNAREPKIVNGPEVLNKFVGQSEENIRKLFADAEKEQKEKGDESALHIIIFDELDAVCKQRGTGSSGGTGVGDGIVNQLLAKLDGVDQLNNLLLIGMTNRRDMIDTALLRPGRLEVQLEIHLPDEKGRESIFKIHTEKMRKNGKLNSDVDIKRLAKMTPNYSGAEIFGVQKSASSFALQRHIKGGTVATIDPSVIDMQIGMADFVAALGEVKPLFGAKTEDLERFVEGGIIPFSTQIESILEQGRRDTDMIRNGGRSLHTVLIHGPVGTGKTALAVKIALDSGFPFIKMITAGEFISKSDSGKIADLERIFADAYKTPLNCLVIDNVELMLDWVDIGPRFSPQMLSALKSLMSTLPPVGRPLLIIATSTNYKVMKDLKLRFDANIAVPNVETQQELAHVLQKSSKFSKDDIKRAISNLESMSGSKNVGVGVKAILTAVQQTARQGEHAPEVIANILAEKMAEASDEADADVRYR